MQLLAEHQAGSGPRQARARITMHVTEAVHPVRPYRVFLVAAVVQGSSATVHIGRHSMHVFIAPCVHQLCAASLQLQQCEPCVEHLSHAVPLQACVTDEQQERLRHAVISCWGDEGSAQALAEGDTYAVTCLEPWERRCAFSSSMIKHRRPDAGHIGSMVSSELGCCTLLLQLKLICGSWAST